MSGYNSQSVCCILSIATRATKSHYFFTSIVVMKKLQFEEHLTEQFSLKAYSTPKMKMLSLIMYPHVIPNL